jgi:ABC-2 type transport system ATP-binding protein
MTRLTPFRTRRADRLSGGMKQKLALACTLVHEPEVILLDEPTTGVDPVSRREFWKLLSEFLAQGLTIVMATPYLDEAERCSRVALLHEGRVLAMDDRRRCRPVCRTARGGRGRCAAAAAGILCVPGVDDVRSFGVGLRRLTSGTQAEE